MKYRMEETLEDIDDLEIPKLRTEPAKKEEDSLRCSECNTRFSSRNLLENHILVAHKLKKDDSSSLSPAAARRSRTSKVDDDEETSYKSRTFKCDECNKEFRSETTLRIHKDGHDEDRREAEEDVKRAEADKERQRKRAEFNAMLELSNKPEPRVERKIAVVDSDKDGKSQ